jgi:hypothetical protein
MSLGLEFQVVALKVEHFMSQIAVHGVLSSDHRRFARGQLSVSVGG